MKKILITGVAGFIGSTLCDSLLSKGIKVVGVDNFSELYDPEIKRRNIKNALSNTNFTLYEEDILSKNELNKIFQKEKPDAVVHIAGITGMKHSMENPDKFYQNNVTGTFNTIEACRIAGVKQFIYTSTATVYGELKTVAEEDLVLPNALNTYALSKKMGEDIALFYSEKFKINVTVLRLSTVYGPRQRPIMGISTFVEAIKNGKELKIWGDGQAFRNYLFVGDCIAAFEAALKYSFECQVFNICGKEQVSINKVIEVASELLGQKVRVKNVLTPEIIPHGISLNSEKAKDCLKYTPKYNFKEGMEEYINWYNNLK